MPASSRKTVTRETPQSRARAGKAEDKVPASKRKARVATQDAVHQTPGKTGTVARVEDQFCVRCGRGRDRDGITFRSPLALKCEECDEERAVERKDYHKNYHKARNHAISRLIELHQREFEKLLIEERNRMAEADASQ